MPVDMYYKYDPEKARILVKVYNFSAFGAGGAVALCYVPGTLPVITKTIKKYDATNTITPVEKTETVSVTMKRWITVSVDELSPNND